MFRVDNKKVLRISKHLHVDKCKECLKKLQEIEKCAEALEKKRKK